jgi:hypothetical protein
MSVLAEESDARMRAVRAQVRTLRTQFHGPGTSTSPTTTTTTPSPVLIDLPHMVRVLADLVELAERAWSDAREHVDRGDLYDYQTLGESLQDLFANVFTGFAIVAEEYDKLTASGDTRARLDLTGLLGRMRALVNALDSTWPWLNNQPGLFDPADLRAAVEEYRRGEFVDLKEFIRGVDSPDK